MSEQIKVGDLVMVVRTPICGCPSKVIGHVFRVSEICNGLGRYECGHGDGGEDYCVDVSREYRVGAWRLKRIPPLDELEGVKRDEGIWI